LRRAFGFGNTSDFDPFLLLDDFRNDVPEDYLAGFPWHPHRGIETITYVLAGTVDHGDSMGNHGAIAAGDVQWMTAGRGDHSSGDAEGGSGWPDARFPAMGEPAVGRYRDVQINWLGRDAIGRPFCPPEGSTDDAHGASVIVFDQRNLSRLHLLIMRSSHLSDGRRKALPIETGRHAFAYVFAGGGKFCNASAPLAVPTESVGWWDKTPPLQTDNRSMA